MKLDEIIFPKKLESKKIRLRKLKPEDTPVIYEIYSNEDSAKLDDWIPYTKIEEAKALINKANKDYINKSELRYGIEDVTRNILVGSCGIFGFDEWNEKCMLYYLTHHNERNMGYASEAVQLLVRYAFEELKANRIEAYITPGNDSSIRVLEKNGFTNEGLLRQMEFYKGQFWDGIVMAILKRDYEA